MLTKKKWGMLSFQVRGEEYQFPVDSIEDAQNVFATFRTELDGVGFGSRDLTATPVVWSFEALDAEGERGACVATLNYNGTIQKKS